MFMISGVIILILPNIFDDQPEDELEEIIQTKSSQAVESRLTPVNFHDECLIKIQQKLGINFIKQTRVAYSDKEKSAGLICTISKAHKQGKFEKFWFAFHPHQRDFLKEFPKSYVSYGCGSADNTFLIPFLEFKPFVKICGLLKTKKEYIGMS